MPSKTRLSVVKSGDRAALPQTTNLTVAEAAATGDQRVLLLALRARTAAAVADPKCPPRDLAALTRRLQEIAKELAALDLADRDERERGGPVADEPFDASAL